MQNENDDFEIMPDSTAVERAPLMPRAEPDNLFPSTAIVPTPPPEPNDGMVRIILAKEWRGCPIGSSVRVDPLRADWMRDNGYEDTRPELPPIGLMPNRKVT